jgi:hypothetical protein
MAARRFGDHPRALAKEASRRSDARALASGRKSAAELRRENESFAALARSARVNFEALRSLG